MLSSSSSSTGYFSNPFIGWCLILCRPVLCALAWFEAAGLGQIRSQGTPLFLILLVPLLCDVCVFGSESGIPACSHMLFYPSVASGAVSPPSSPYPPPAPLALLNWPSLQPSVFLHTLSLPPPVSGVVSLRRTVFLLTGFLGLHPSDGEGWCGLLSFSLLPCGLVPVSERKIEFQQGSCEALWN